MFVWFEEGNGVFLFLLFSFPTSCKKEGKSLGIKDRGKEAASCALCPSSTLTHALRGMSRFQMFGKGRGVGR